MGLIQRTPTDSTDFHRWNLYKELPQNSRNSQKLLRRVWHPCHTHAFGIILPQIPLIFTDGTYTRNSHRFHRFSQKYLYKELPQNSQNSQKFRCIYCSVSMAGMPYHPIHLCKSVKSVGVFLYKYFREFRGICGSFPYKYFCEFCEFCGSFLYKYFCEFREICGSF